MLWLVACGQPAGRETAGESGSVRIINGTAVDLAVAPQMVEVVLLGADGSQGICSGTVIGSDTVLTAAHCFVEPYSAIFVRTATASRPVLAVSVPADFRRDDAAGALFNDVAVLQTEPLALPTLPIIASQPTAAGDAITLYGFGINEDGEAGVLRLGSTEVSQVTENHLFSGPFGGSGINSCNGDSGGPAIKAITTETGARAYGIVGIVSSGSVEGCGNGDVTLYANLQNPSILAFIREHAPDAVVQ